MKRENMKYFKYIMILILATPVSLFAWKMESGTVTLPATTAGSSTWQNVTLQQTYDTMPLIFALTTSETNPYTLEENPASLRVNNISTTGFDITQVEAMDSPTDTNGAHPALTIHYIAVEPGIHYLPDGRMFVAGEFNTTMVAEEVDRYEQIFFPRAFGNTPVVLSMIQSLENEENTLPGEPTRPLLTTATKELNTESVELALERSKLREGSVIHEETIGYLAIEGNIQGTFVDADANTVQYETISTPQTVNGWDDECDQYNYINAYTSMPNLFGNKNTRNGGHGGWLRQCSNSLTQAGVTVDEDIYDGSNRKHGASEIAGLLAVSDDFKADFEDIDRTPIAEYRMDECYWTGVTGEVKDSSPSASDATSYNNASVITGIINNNNAGYFPNVDQIDSGKQDYIDVDNVGNTSGQLSISFWVKLDEQLGLWATVLSKTKAYNWNDGWGFVNPAGAGDTLRFYINSYTGTSINTTLTVGEGWAHFIGTYDGNTLRLYKNGVEVGNGVTDNSGIANSQDPLRMAYDDDRDSRLQGAFDEVKLYNIALNGAEVTQIYNNESNGLNHDGTIRAQKVCNASIAANTWEMISIPQESRSPTILGVQDVFGDDFVGANYNAGDTDGWILWRRDYNDTNNLHTYVKVDYAANEPIEFDKGYWLGSTLAVDWEVDETKAVDYNSSYNGTIHCASEKCVEVNLEPVNIDGVRYNLSNFPGKSPIDWAKCRFIISDPDGNNVEVLTPKSADAAGYVSRTIAIWPGGTGNGTDGQVLDGDYTECHDESPTGCDLLPYHSVWIEVLTPTLGKTIKLLIPEE